MMALKGGISFPIVLVVTILVVAIVVALVYIFVFQTKDKLEDAFGGLTKSVSDFGCSAMGPMKSFVCPGG